MQQIFKYYKKYGYTTIVIRANFRNIGEISELAGCDYLIIAPNLLEQLYNSQDPLSTMLQAGDVASFSITKKCYINDEALFGIDFNKDAMAVHKLSEGISKFATDAVTLRRILKDRMRPFDGDT